MITIPITLQSDENGYFDRECPNENCLYQFKIKLRDWEEKVSDEKVYCPMCGHIDTSDKWWTQEQLDQISGIATSYVMSNLQQKLDKSFKKLERSTRRNKFFKITYKPGRRLTFVNNPVGQMPEWEQEITCEQCGTTYSVIGSAYFCPCCGYNSAKAAYEESLDSILKMIESLSQMRELFTASYGVDKADTMCRSMLEDTLGNCVSAFQKFAECKYKELSSSLVRVNDFQIVDKGSRLFEAACGKDYTEWLSKDEIDYMKRYFQKRHLFEHNNGMVDQQYIDKSGDASYIVGQRMIIRESEVIHLIDILKKLGNGLIGICKEE